MAVDLGTANTLVYVRGRGVVLDEPSVVAVNARDGRPLAVGIEAKKMIGRTPDHIKAIRPLKDGVIADFDICEKMLRYFIQRVHPRKWAKPRMVICVPSGITGVEQRAVQEAAQQAGARKEAYIIEEPMAAAIGAGLPVHEPAGNMIVDIGGGTTEVAVISLGGIVASESIRIAGDELDEAIINFVKKEYSLALGERTSEEIKIALGSAFPLQEELYAEVRGRDLVTGLPKTIVVSTEEIRDAIEEPVAGDRRRGEGDARQDAARTRGRHHVEGHRRHRRRRVVARPARAALDRDGDADRDRRQPAVLGRARLRAMPRELRRPEARPDLVRPAVGQPRGDGRCSTGEPPAICPARDRADRDHPDHPGHAQRRAAGPLGALGRGAHTVVAPIEGAVDAVAEPVSDWWHGRHRLRPPQERQPRAAQRARDAAGTASATRKQAIDENQKLQQAPRPATPARRRRT